MNINLAISQGSKILRNKFITNSRLDSEILMAKTINKDINIKKSSTSSHYKFDLHGYSLIDANNKAKEVLLYCSEKNIREILLITGKGLHSKTDSVYESDKFNKLKYSVPDFLMSNTETSGLISNIKIAEADKGGEGAIVVKLKKL